MNGWIRLWVLVSVIWISLIGAMILGSELRYHMRSKNEAYDLDGSLLAENIFKPMNCSSCPEIPISSLKDEELKAIEDGKISEVVLEPRFKTFLEAEYNEKLWGIWEDFIEIGFLPPLLFFFFGYGVAWVRRGFKAEN